MKRNTELYCIQSGLKLERKCFTALNWQGLNYFTTLKIWKKKFLVIWTYLCDSQMIQAILLLSTSMTQEKGPTTKLPIANSKLRLVTLNYLLCEQVWCLHLNSLWLVLSSSICLFVVPIGKDFLWPYYLLFNLFDILLTLELIRSETQNTKWGDKRDSVMGRKSVKVVEQYVHL